MEKSDDSEASAKEDEQEAKAEKTAGQVTSAKIGRVGSRRGRTQQKELECGGSATLRLTDQGAGESRPKTRKKRRRLVHGDLKAEQN